MTGWPLFAWNSCTRSRPSNWPPNWQYPNARELMWVQEEPKNQGAWYQIRHRLEKLLSPKQTLLFAGRPSSASPAVGYMSKARRPAQVAAGRGRGQIIAPGRPVAVGHMHKTPFERAARRAPHQGPSHADRNQNPGVRRIRDRRHHRRPAQKVGDAVPVMKTWPTSKPTRSCWNCRPRKPACWLS